MGIVAATLVARCRKRATGEPLRGALPTSCRPPPSLAPAGGGAGDGGVAMMHGGGCIRHRVQGGVAVALTDAVVCVGLIRRRK
eukprot:4726965-Prymnesium_polylepis.1